MGKTIFAIIDSRTNKVVDSVQARESSKTVKEFKMLFKKNYTKLNWYKFLPEELSICDLKELRPDYSDVFTYDSDCISNEDLKKLGYVKAPEDYHNIIYSLLFKIPYYSVDGDIYTPKESLEYIKKIISTEYKPLVIKGTDEPYWFNVDGNLVASDNPNWFIHLFEKFRVVNEAALVDYKPKSTKKAE